jgi:hypothetical protein
VRDVRVLERIADGLGIPRARLGVSYGEEIPDAPSAEEEVDEDVKRRALIATTSAAALGEVLFGMGEPIEVALPTSQALPSRLSMSHVHTVRAVTDRLRGVARYYGGQGDLLGAAATIYSKWMQAPGTEAVKAGLAAALATLHTDAGWYCYDDGVDGTGHFTRALSLADKFEDTYGVANTAWHAGATLVYTGHPNDALKLFQLGQLRLGGFRLGKPTPTASPADDSRLPVLTARLNRCSAVAWAVMNGSDQATRCLAEAHDGWEPQDAFEHAESDLETAAVQLNLGQLEAAECSATNALRTYREGHRVARTMTKLLLAEVHVRAGEPEGLTLAHHAITEVSTLHSIAARQERLVPLATALEARPGTDTQELARTARKIAATQI